jgi:hypothetical protein
MRFGRLIRDIVLIPLPISLLAVAFFIAGIPEGGVLMALFAAAAAWFIRPRKPQSVAGSIPTADVEEDIAPEVPGAGGPQGPPAR